MPAVAKTSREAIVAAARDLIERDGVAALSIQAVATEVGVRAPSLYKHFEHRAALVRAVSQSVLDKLRVVQDKVATTGSAAEDLRRIAVSHRRFARRSPHLYALVFGVHRADFELEPLEYAASTQTLLERTRVLCGDAALDGARLLVSFTHGFVSMELAGAFRLGGNLDTSFAFGLDRLIASLRPAPLGR